MLKSVQVEIKEFEILAVDSDRARFRARVASGTYMRSVAHDMGRELACGAHLESLRRTSVAEFTLEDAHTLEEITKFCRPDRSIRSPWERNAKRMDPLLRLPNIRVPHPSRVLCERVGNLNFLNL